MFGAGSSSFMEETKDGSGELSNKPEIVYSKTPRRVRPRPQSRGIPKKSGMSSSSNNSFTSNNSFRSSSFFSENAESAKSNEGYVFTVPGTIVEDSNTLYKERQRNPGAGWDEWLKTLGEWSDETWRKVTGQAAPLLEGQLSLVTPQSGYVRQRTTTNIGLTSLTSYISAPTPATISSHSKHNKNNLS